MTKPAIKKLKTPLPNIRLAHGQEALGAGPVHLGNRVLTNLPAGELQESGFFCPEVAAVMELFPGRFKTVFAKGKTS